MNDRPSIAGIGITVVDYLSLLSNFPNSNQKTEALATAIQPGGPACNAMIAANALGAQTWLMTVLGQDREGEFIRDQLRSFGIQTNGIAMDDKIRTPRAFIWSSSKTGNRAIVLDQLQYRSLNPEEINLEILQDLDCLVVDGRDPHCTLFALQQAKLRGVTTLLDAGSPRVGMDAYMEFVDYFIVSCDYAHSVFRGKSDEEALRAMARDFRGPIAITLGVNGLIAHEGGTLFRMPAYPVKALETTGAGDVFHGSFAYACASKIVGSDFRSCLKFASIAAAISCQSLGGCQPYLKLSDILTIFNTWQM